MVLSVEEICNITTDYFSDLSFFPSSKRDEIEKWLEQAQHGDFPAKKKLAAELKKVMREMGIDLTDREFFYPGINAYESIVFKLYGLGVYDAVLSKYPFVESLLIITAQPVSFHEMGTYKNYHDYFPTDMELQEMQIRFARLLNIPNDEGFSKAKGWMNSNIHVTLYNPPRSLNKTIFIRRQITNQILSEVANG